MVNRVISNSHCQRKEHSEAVCCMFWEHELRGKWNKHIFAFFWGKNMKREIVHVYKKRMSGENRNETFSNIPLHMILILRCETFLQIQKTR